MHVDFWWRFGLVEFNALFSVFPRSPCQSFTAMKTKLQLPCGRETRVISEVDLIFLHLVLVLVQCSVHQPIF